MYFDEFLVIVLFINNLYSFFLTKEAKGFLPKKTIIVVTSVQQTHSKNSLLQVRFTPWGTDENNSR
jgi:hypothetical protein